MRTIVCRGHIWSGQGNAPLNEAGRRARRDSGRCWRDNGDLMHIDPPALFNSNSGDARLMFGADHQLIRLWRLLRAMGIIVLDSKTRFPTMDLDGLAKLGLKAQKKRKNALGISRNRQIQLLADTAAYEKGRYRARGAHGSILDNARNCIR